MKVSAKNERAKRAFFRYLKNADRCCDSTVNNIENAILLWEEFSQARAHQYMNYRSPFRSCLPCNISPVS